jgi:hypothetical protein
MRCAAGLVQTNLGDGLINRAKLTVGEEAASKFYVSTSHRDSLDLALSMLLSFPRYQPVDAASDALALTLALL